MQQQHSYPSKRNQWPTAWRARRGATVNDEPLPPKTADRVRRIRQVFLEDCHGHASIAELVDCCDDLGLLDRFPTYEGAYEAIQRALRPISTASPRG